MNENPLNNPQYIQVNQVNSNPNQQLANYQNMQYQPNQPNRLVILDQAQTINTNANIYNQQGFKAKFKYLMRKVKKLPFLQEVNH